MARVHEKRSASQECQCNYETTRQASPCSPRVPTNDNCLHFDAMFRLHLRLQDDALGSPGNNVLKLTKQIWWWNRALVSLRNSVSDGRAHRHLERRGITSAVRR